MYKVLLFCAIICFHASVFADSYVFIKDGDYKLTTRENMNSDMVYDQMPNKYKYLLQPGDYGNLYQIRDTGEMFFVLIHPSAMPLFSRGYEFGKVNVTMHLTYLVTYNNMKIYEFKAWSN